MSLMQHRPIRAAALALASIVCAQLPGYRMALAAEAAMIQATGTASNAAGPAAGRRFAGTVTAIAGNVLTVKDDKGSEAKITVPDSVHIMQLPAGSKSLSAAVPIKVSDIAVGDRVLAKTDPSSDATTLTASTVIAMKQADIAQKQQRDREEWQTRGVNGVVKAVDPASQTVTITTGSGAAAKTLTVKASKSTVVRRYAPDSTKFDDAKASTLDQIKPGDQLRAKGDKNADGTEVAAEEIVSGTFHNIAGTVASLDATSKTLTVNDLATKQPFVVHLDADSQLRKLPPMMAQAMAARLKGNSDGAAGGAGGHPAEPVAGGPPSGAAPPAPPARERQAASGSDPAASGQGPGGGQGRRGGDLQQALNRAPIIQLADLKAGDAVMVLTTEGQAAGSATAITLLAGVESLLQASPSASRSMLSASWNLGGGGAAGQDAQ